MAGVDAIRSAAFATGYQQLASAQSRRAAEQARARAESLEAQAAGERREAEAAQRRAQDIDGQARSARDEADRLQTARSYADGFNQGIERATETVARLAPYDAQGQATETATETTGTQVSVVA